VEERKNETTTNHLAMNITQAQKTRITRELLKFDILRGLDRSKSKGYAISKIAEALGKAGFFLDTVTGDILLGDGGSRFLAIRWGLNCVQVENASIYFVWEKLDDDRMEFLAYVS
jgi:hypothetical protein